MGDAGAEVTSRVDGIPGGATQRSADGDDEQSDSERADGSTGEDTGLEIDRSGGGVVRDDDPQNQHPGTDGLSDGVPERIADLGTSGKGAKFESRVAVLVVVLLVGQPRNDGADEGTEELGDDVCLLYTSPSPRDS